MRSVVIIAAALAVLPPAVAAAQTSRWGADVTVGYAGFVDDATKNFLVTGAGVRRYLTPQISIGPELVLMFSSDSVRDRNVMLTGNVMFEGRSNDRGGQFQVKPFLVAGVGQFWGRDNVRGGHYWSSDPAFTAGGGVRLRLGEAVSTAAEYRIGWELHQRLTGSIGFHW